MAFWLFIYKARKNAKEHTFRAEILFAHNKSTKVNVCALCEFIEARVPAVIISLLKIIVRSFRLAVPENIQNIIFNLCYARAYIL